MCNGSYYKSFDVVAIAPYMSSSMKRGDGSLVSIDEFFNSTVYAGISASLAQLNATAQQIAQSPAPGIQLATYEAGPDYSSLTGWIFEEKEHFMLLPYCRHNRKTTPQLKQ